MPSRDSHSEATAPPPGPQRERISTEIRRRPPNAATGDDASVPHRRATLFRLSIGVRQLGGHPAVAGSLEDRGQTVRRGLTVIEGQRAHEPG